MCPLSIYVINIRSQEVCTHRALVVYPLISTKLSNGKQQPPARASRVAPPC